MDRRVFLGFLPFIPVLVFLGPKAQPIRFQTGEILTAQKLNAALDEARGQDA